MNIAPVLEDLLCLHSTNSALPVFLSLTASDRHVLLAKLQERRGETCPVRHPQLGYAVFTLRNLRRSQRHRIHRCLQSAHSDGPGGARCALQVCVRVVFFVDAVLL